MNITENGSMMSLQLFKRKEISEKYDLKKNKTKSPFLSIQNLIKAFTRASSSLKFSTSTKLIIFQ